VLAEDGQKLTQVSSTPFDHTAGGGALFLTGGIERAAEIVVDRQQIARELGAAILLCLAAVAFGCACGCFPHRPARAAYGRAIRPARPAEGRARPTVVEGRIIGDIDFFSAVIDVLVVHHLVFLRLSHLTLL
jgi:hypothetical protein